MHINLDELQAILGAARKQRYEDQRFMAAIQGIDIDKESNDRAAERFEEVKKRADAQLQGRSVEELEYDELGLDVEIEE